jgi:hypothetical protein
MTEGIIQKVFKKKKAEYEKLESVQRVWDIFTIEDIESLQQELIAEILNEFDKGYVIYSIDVLIKLIGDNK